MDIILLCVQAIVAAACFILPGLAAIQRAFPGAAGLWPPAFMAAASFVVSSLIVAAVQSLSLAFLPPPAARAASWCLLAAIAFSGATEGRRALARMAAEMSAHARRLWLIALGVYLFSTAIMPMSPYPSLLTVSLGDRPSYYRLAANLVAGNGWMLDFYIGDYVGGSALYLTANPLPALVTTFLFQIVGVNGYSLGLYCTLAGVLHLALLAEFVCGGRGQAESRPSAGRIAILALLVPTYGRLIVLGAETVPGALALFAAVAAMVQDKVDRLPRRLAVFAASVGFLLLVRPEAAMLGVLLVAVYPAAALVFSTRVPAKWRAAAVLAAAALGVACWLALPSLSERLPHGLRNFSVYYLKYDAGSGTFGWMHSPWWKINEMFCYDSFSDTASALPAANENVASEIREHPLALLVLLVANFRGTLAGCMTDFAILTYMHQGQTQLALAVLAIVFAFLDPRHRPALAAILLSLFILPLVSAGFAGRHLLLAVSVLLAMAARSVVMRYAVMWPRLVTAVLAIVVGCNAIDMLAIRFDPGNKTYVPILKELKAIARPGDLIAASYPQIMAYGTGCRAVGCTWFADNLDGVIRRWNPEIVVIDDARDGPMNFSQVKGSRGFSLPGYRVHSLKPDLRYAIFVREDHPAKGEAAPATDEGRALR